MISIKILVLQETNYVNEWIALLEGHDVKAVLIKPNPKLLSIKSYHSYDDSFVKKIYLPFKARGKKIASVGIFEHFYYTIFAFLLLPLALMQDVVIFVTPSYFHTAIIPILKLFGKKVYIVVLDPQEVLKDTAKRNIFFAVYFRISSFLENLAIRQADKVFVVSMYLKNSYSHLNRNIYFAPSGTDVEYIGKIEPKRIFKERTITYLGSFDFARGVDILVKAFKKVNKKHNAKLVMLGGGIEEENIRKLAGNSKNIHFSGFIPHQEALSICKGSDILVMPFRRSPALFKTFSLKTFEYIALGIPIVVTDTGEHAELIKKMECGIVTEPDEESISRAINLLLQNKKLYRSIKKKCENSRNLVDYKVTRKEFLEAFN